MTLAFTSSDALRIAAVRSSCPSALASMSRRSASWSRVSSRGIVVLGVAHHHGRLERQVGRDALAAKAFETLIKPGLARLHRLVLDQPGAIVGGCFGLLLLGRHVILANLGRRVPTARAGRTAGPSRH